MTTLSVSGPDDLKLVLDAGAPGDRYVLHAGVYGALDSYRQRILGGPSWSKRTRIEARVRTSKGQRVVDRVVFRGSASDDFVIRLAHEQNSYLQIGTAEAPIAVDASGLRIVDASGKPTPATGIKVTNSGLPRSHHIHIYAHVHHAYRQGVLVTGTHNVQLYGSSRDNGWDDAPDELNKNHGVYLGLGAWDCESHMDTSGNAAYGVCEYGGEQPGLCGRNVIGGFHVANGRLAPRSGILLGGTDSKVVRAMSTQHDQYGVHFFRTARNCSISGEPASYLACNRLGRVYTDPDAIGCVDEVAA